MTWSDLPARERLCSLCERKAPESESRREWNGAFDRPRSMRRWLCGSCYPRIATFVLEQRRDMLARFWRVSESPGRLSAPPLPPLEPRKTSFEEWDAESKGWRPSEVDTSSVIGNGFLVHSLLEKGEKEAALFHAATLIREAADSSELTRMDVELCLSVLLDARLARPDLLEKLKRELFVD